MTISIALWLASTAVSGISACVVSDDFSDESIASFWYQYQIGPAVVSLTEVGAADKWEVPFLEASFDVVVADPDGAYAALLSNDPDGDLPDWSIDLTQSGAVYLDLEFSYLPSYPGNILGLGLGFFNGFTPEDEVDMVVDLTWGVAADEYAIRVNQVGSDEVNLGMWEHDHVYVWWVSDRGVWLGYQLGVPLHSLGDDDEGKPLSFGGDEDIEQLNVALFAYNVNNGVAESGIGFRDFCIVDTDVDTIPEPCQWDVMADYDINRDDVFAVIDSWGSDDMYADINADATVDVLDLIAVLTHWGPCLDWGSDE